MLGNMVFKGSGACLRTAHRHTAGPPPHYRALALLPFTRLFLIYNSCWRGTGAASTPRPALSYDSWDFIGGFDGRGSLGRQCPPSCLGEWHTLPLLNTIHISLSSTVHRGLQGWCCLPRGSATMWDSGCDWHAPGTVGRDRTWAKFWRHCIASPPDKQQGLGQGFSLYNLQPQSLFSWDWGTSRLSPSSALPSLQGTEPVPAHHPARLQRASS